jgi:hypothetical protein
LAIGDVRKSHGDGQDGSCTAVRVKSFALLADRLLQRLPSYIAWRWWIGFSEDDGRPIAEGARLFAWRRRHEKFGAVGGFIANVLRTTRSTLKQAFSSWNVSISHGHFEFR